MNGLNARGDTIFVRSATSLIPQILPQLNMDYTQPGPPPEMAVLPQSDVVKGIVVSVGELVTGIAINSEVLYKKSCALKYDNKDIIKASDVLANS